MTIMRFLLLSRQLVMMAYFNLEQRTQEMTIYLKRLLTHRLDYAYNHQNLQNIE